MKRELFGPLFVVHVYPDSEYSSILKTVDKSKYALTGSVFAKDIKAAQEAQNVLKHAAGNFYINTKFTGSIVSQQPFGGSRDLGSNDKTGTIGLISRYCSIRTIKEEFGSTEELQYPSNEV
ncbi:1-pyrroline-5-carboxylate dehydrogenase [Fusarium falciforme]